MIVLKLFGNHSNFANEYSTSKETISILLVKCYQIFKYIMKILNISIYTTHIIQKYINFQRVMHFPVIKKNLKVLLSRYDDSKKVN